ncbi:MAG: hypothetical protein O3A46_07595 [Candidatus Poribacteria bacterium]|nr:hypothetical protein [Candidatus Poribacteria bacterium]
MDEWIVPIRYPDSFFDNDDFRKVADDARAKIDAGQAVDGGFAFAV